MTVVPADVLAPVVVICSSRAIVGSCTDSLSNVRTKLDTIPRGTREFSGGSGIGDRGDSPVVPCGVALMSTPP